jgi:uncharacterized lipoprotein YajG
MKRTISLLMLAVGVWLLAACANSAQTPTSGAYPPSGEAIPDPAAESSPAKPTPRAAMQATDPATVQLAAGKPQLVEFFAFW